VHQLLQKNNSFLFLIVLSLLSIFGCEKKNNEIVDPNSSAPELSNTSFSVSIVDTDTMNIAGQQGHRPDDLLTIRGNANVSVLFPGNNKKISIVKYSVTNSRFSSPFTEGELHDDGVIPDAKGNDSVYSGYIEFQIQRVFVGTFTIKLWCETTADYISNTILLPLQIIRLSLPPVISDLEAPDTVNLTIIKDEFLIKIKVIDPDGQDDIKAVMRFTPSGLITRFYPLNHDMNDSIYTERVGVIPRPDLGAYLFLFRAVDRSNDSSNVLTKTIVIIDR
jgi:hypothetical protein